MLKTHLLPSDRRLKRLRGGIAAGSMMYLDLQSQLQRYLGLDEREIIKPMRGLIGKSETLIDIGANDGYYTLAFLHSSATSIIACEPGPAVKEIIANAEANGYSVGDRFQIVRTAIGMSAGCIPISQLVAGKKEPIFIKVDVDGGEFDVLQSADSCATIRLSWIVETHSKELELACMEWLLAHQFDARIINNSWWRVFLPELRPRHSRWILAVSRNY